MNARAAAFWAMGLTMAWLLIPAAPTSATVVFDDHFEGNSGGIPVNWLGFGDGSVVEAGTTVTFYDEFAMGTNEDFDPNEAAETTITTLIESTTHHAHVGLIDFAQFDNHFWVKIYAQDGEIEVKASDVAGGEEEYIVGYVAGYAGGAIQLTVVLTSEFFSVATDSPPFSSGPIDYSTVFTSFTRADLGNAAKLILQNECAPADPPCSSVIDRITLEFGPSTAVESTAWGRVKALYHTRP